MKSYMEFVNKPQLNEDVSDQEQKVVDSIHARRSAGSAVGQGTYEDIADELAKLFKQANGRAVSRQVIAKIIDKHVKYFEQNVKENITDVLNNSGVKFI